MATKPTFATWNYEWATAAAAGRVTDPSAFRAGGWPFENEFPSNAANYHFRTLGLWTAFFDDMFGSAGTLTLDASNTYLEVTTDGASAQVWTFVGAGTDCEVVSDSFNGTTYLLGGTGLRVQTGGTGTEDDGDLEWFGSNAVDAAVGRMNLSRKAGHSTITDVGLNVPCMRLTYADADDATAPTGDFATVFPRDETLYIDNLAKAVVEINGSWDSGTGVFSLDSYDGYNVSSVTLNTAGTPNQLDISVANTFTASAIFATILDSGNDPIIVKAGLSKQIQATAFNGTNWVDAFDTVASFTGGKNCTISVVIY